MFIVAKVVCFRDKRYVLFPKYFSGQFQNLKEAVEKIRMMLRSDFGHHYDKVYCFLWENGKRKKIKIRVEHVCRR
jgi:hypothetical protein